MTSAGGLWSAYSNLCSQLACAVCNSCSSRHPYHRHCGCSLHDGNSKFETFSSNKNQVKVSNHQTRSRLYRTLSVQNLVDRGGLSSFSSSSSLSSLAGNEVISSFCDSSFVDQVESCESSESDDNLIVAMMDGLVTMIQTAEEVEDAGQEKMCCNVDDGDHGLPALEKKPFLAYRSSMFQSAKNLRAYTELDSNSGYALRGAHAIRAGICKEHLNDLSRFL